MEKSGIEKAREQADKLKKSATPKVETAVVPLDENWAKANAQVGMRGVDPADIKPPEIRLIQKSSDLEAFQDTEGKNPKLGQFFNTGNNEILPEFDCFFVWAQKGTYIDRNKDGAVRDQYQAIGLMQGDLSMFGYKFRSSALQALSPLFTAAVSQKKPMFGFLVHVDAKEIKGTKGTWWVPAIHVGKYLDDFAVLKDIYSYAVKFDHTVEAAAVEDEEEEIETTASRESKLADPGTVTPPEDVKPDEIPFN
jgi:hypothetical protein